MLYELKSSVDKSNENHTRDVFVGQETVNTVGMEDQLDDTNDFSDHHRSYSLKDQTFGAIEEWANARTAITSQVKFRHRYNDQAIDNPTIM